MSERTPVSEPELQPDSDRRGFLQVATAATVGSVLGFSIPFRENLKDGFVPIALAQDKPGLLPGKEGLVSVGDKPINMETPPHLLDDEVTPASRMFVRNNGAIPENKNIADTAWTLTIDGEVNSPSKFTIEDLKKNFENVKLRLQIECGGNGRAFFQPAASGNQWTFGAIACPEWTGVRLRDVLKKVGVKDSAVYTGHYGNDPDLSGDEKKVTISRGVPIAKATEEHTLIVWAMNGESLPLANGYPLRLVVPGWVGSTSQKWLTRIWLRDKLHDGSKMGGQSYRIPKYPVAPGTEVPKDDFVIMEAMPVKSLVTMPETGAKVKAKESVEVRGHAWAGDLEVKDVHISTDFGANWLKADLSRPANKYAWQRWKARITLPTTGYYEVWARATDAKGNMQPQVVPGWNPGGYGNNMQHRIAVFAT